MFTIISAINSDGGIGKDNDLIIKSPADMKHFKETTEGNVVVMGFNTWKSLKCKPLPNRFNIVIVGDDKVCSENELRDLRNQHRDICFFRDIEEVVILVMKCQLDPNKVFIIGGARIYKDALDKNLVGRMILTRFNEHDKKADVFFPDVNWKYYERKYINYKVYNEEKIVIHDYNMTNERASEVIVKSITDIFNKYNCDQRIIHDYTGRLKYSDIKDIMMVELNERNMYVRQSYLPFNYENIMITKR